MDNSRILKSAAIITYGEYLGKWMHETWSAHNCQYFDGALTIGAIEFGLTPHGHALGYYNFRLNRITLHSSLINPRSSAPWSVSKKYLGEKYASDVLLHEMIHQYLYQFHTEEYTKQDSHNGILWCGEINRLSKELNIDCKTAAPVKPRRVNGKVKRLPLDGCMPLKEIASFPYSQRSLNYYL